MMIISIQVMMIILIMVYEIIDNIKKNWRMLKIKMLKVYVFA